MSNLNLPFPDAFGGALRTQEKAEFTVLGVPFDGKSSFRKGAAGGPDAIRQASTVKSINSFTESGVDLAHDTTIIDAGNIAFAGDYGSYITSIEQKISEILQTDSVPVVLGGDHSIAYPVVRGMLNKYRSLNIVWLDAHPDIYPDYDGDRYSHACPMARILELNGIGTVVQAGIRATARNLDNSLQKAGVRVITTTRFEEVAGLALPGPTYLSVDIDILDPAYAPGVGNPVPGGISTRQLIDTIHSFNLSIVGLDVVEVNPDYDHASITAAAAAKIAIEIIGHIVSTRQNE